MTGRAADVTEKTADLAAAVLDHLCPAAAEQRVRAVAVAADAHHPLAVLEPLSRIFRVYALAGLGVGDLLHDRFQPSGLVRAPFPHWADEDDCDPGERRNDGHDQYDAAANGPSG